MNTEANAIVATATAISAERQSTFDRVVSVVKPYVRDAAALALVSEATSILQDLKVNSARLVDIIIAFEDEFDIVIDDAQADNVRTIGDAIDMVSAPVA